MEARDATLKAHDANAARKIMPEMQDAISDKFAIKS